MVAVRRFQCVACPSPIGCCSALHFSGVRVHVWRLRGVPCGKLLPVVRRKQRFVSTFESSPAVDLSC